MYAKSVLLVDHHEGEVTERYRLLKQSMRANQNVDASLAKRGKQGLTIAALLTPGVERNAQTCGRGEGLNGFEMLTGE
jgi:hypothetical protein